MPIEFTPENISSRLEEFFNEDRYGYKSKIMELASKYPDSRSLFVDFRDIDIFDQDLGYYLLDHPDDVLVRARDVIVSLLPPMESKVDVLNLRILNLPEDAKVEVRDLRKKFVSKFISIRGLIRRATDVRPKLLYAYFECLRCKHIIVEKQESTQLREPLECYKDQGGCGKVKGQTQFTLKTDVSELMDTQKLEIQERPEGLRGGAQPQRLSGWIEDDLCGQIMVGDRVVLNGVLRTFLRDSRQRGTQLEIFLDVKSFEMEEKEYEDVELSPEDETVILTMSKDPEIVRNIIGSISPTIYGLTIEKEALALQLFGGVPKKMPDGTKIRGDIHVLLIGDPGTAKSQLLRYISDLAPRGIYTAGKTASAAGLTAAAVKDESFGEGRWVLEAGALVLADMGVACIDELDKMTPQDRSSMHEVMEQQTVSVSKAGITATLQARCTILGAANPKSGRFDSGRTIAEQIELPPTLLSRFDVIFPLLDNPKPELDESMAEHIIRGHLIGEKMKEGSEEGSTLETDYLKESLEPVYKPELLRKYVLYSRKKIFPVMSEEAMDTIKTYYVSIRRRKEDEKGPIPITPRQLEAIIRLSEARARMRLNKKVTQEDAQRAIEITEYSLKKVATEPGSEGGILDIDIITTGRSRSQWNIVKAIKDAIAELSESEKDGAEQEKIVSEVMKQGIDHSKIEITLKRLLESGEIYQPKHERYRLARER